MAAGTVPAVGTAQDTRASLWARYDEGGLGTDELDARLKAVDRAGDDPEALERALTGPVRTPKPGRARWLRIAAAAGVVVVLLVGIVSVLGGDDDEPGTSPGTGQPIPLPIPEPPGPVPAEPVDCPGLDDVLARFEDLDESQPPANPALLSDPAALPDGYTVADEVTLVPGSDPDLSMGVAAGTPLPVDVFARQLVGPLTVTMRSFTYESDEAAGQSGLSVIDDAVCSYGATSFEVPDRPEINGSVVSGVIPTTAFASWRLAERRFTVAVQSAGDDEASITEAQQLAGDIAALELDAARTAP